MATSASMYIATNEPPLGVIDLNEPVIDKSVQRVLVVGGETIHLKCVFNGQADLEKALINIILRRLTEQKKIS